MRYVIGLDFGTLSARGVLINAETGEELREATAPYKHGVMDEKLHTGLVLPKGFALQHPMDYIDSLSFLTHELINNEGVMPENVVGIGIDFTSSTVLPIDEKGMPLCIDPEFENDPHSYVKLWKHHGAEEEAEEITEKAVFQGEKWLFEYGGKVSCEWAIPKILETLRKSPRVYEAAYRFIEAGDWLSLILTGNEIRSASFAGYKYFWNEESGYPCEEFFASLDEKMRKIADGKLGGEVVSVGKSAGTVNSRGSAITGLCEGCAVAVPIIDAHSPMLSLNMTRGGDLIMIIGTSACYIANSEQKKRVDGLWGCVRGGVIPDIYTYEAGQSAFGDVFDWFVKNQVPVSYHNEAAERKISIHALLRDKAMKLSPGESGLIALDWLNGNRSILGDSSLSGMVLGLNLLTKPEEIYLALIEATAFGAKIILDQYEKNGIKIKRICATGGIAKKDEMLMQILADVLNRDIRVAKSTQAAARGSAIYASVAAKIYPTVDEAAERFSEPDYRVFSPKSENVEIYSVLFREYKLLHDYFGKENNVMARLKKISAERKKYKKQQRK